MTRPIRWLHLSDLHYGCPGKELWEQVEPDFRRSVERRVAEDGPPDLVLFTGDLAFSGKPEEYEEVDRFLDDLLGWLTSNGGPEPVLLPVPGNHDLIRPEGTDARTYHILRSLDVTTDDSVVEDLYQELWKERDASFVEPLFAGYRGWFEKRIRPQLEKRGRVHFSHFPCDYTFEVNPDGAFPLAVVGLNATWLQYTGGEFEGRLLLPLEQLRAALAPPEECKPYGVFDRCDRSLLLIHQPPSWLSDRGHEIFDADIYPSGRLTACLYGHMHEARSRYFVSAGAEPKTLFQSPSLFGLEKWGKSDEDRVMGFTWGTLTQDGEIRIRPLRRQKRGDGSWSFGHDLYYHDEDPAGVLLRPGRATGGGEESKSRGFDQRAYLDAVIASTDHLKIRGIAAERSREALSPAIENLYTPLRYRDLLGVGSTDDFGGRSGGMVRLTEILPRGRRILIEGQPGAGKTTFLRFVACMHAGT